MRREDAISAARQFVKARYGVCHIPVDARLVQLHPGDPLFWMVNFGNAYLADDGPVKEVIDGGELVVFVSDATGGLFFAARDDDSFSLKPYF